jgi:hypothetical protein
MFYNKGELTYEKCIKLKKDGFNIPLYKCPVKNKCGSWKKLKGRARCPGGLSTNCGWVNGSNIIALNIDVPEKFIPKHTVPII